MSTAVIYKLTQTGNRYVSSQVSYDTTISEAINTLNQTGKLTIDFTEKSYSFRDTTNHCYCILEMPSFPAAFDEALKLRELTPTIKEGIDKRQIGIDQSQTVESSYREYSIILNKTN